MGCFSILILKMKSSRATIQSNVIEQTFGGLFFLITENSFKHFSSTFVFTLLTVRVAKAHTQAINDTKDLL